MGAWGIKPFENDDAGDWECELEDDGLDAVRRAFDLSDDYIEVDEGGAAIAAAETVAAMRGNPAADLPEDVRTFAAKHPEVADDLLHAAREAVAAVDSDGERSEVFGLWEDAGTLDEWRATIADLRRRLE